MGNIMHELSVTLGHLNLNSPVIMSSGTFEYGLELKDFLNYENIGAIVTKTVTINPRQGNPQPRVWETASGLINSIGIQNIGIEKFISTKLPLLRKLKPKIIVSFTGENKKEMENLAVILSKQPIDGIELNLSCPNFQQTGNMVSQDSTLTYEIVCRIKEICDKLFLIVKLSPNVTDIVEIAKAAESAGADAVSLINTVKALAIDFEKRKVIAGGLSGPAIKPVGLRAVYETYRNISIPLIGLGGIISATDALEYLLVGASAVGIGSGLFSNPRIVNEICVFLQDYMNNYGYNKLSEITGLFNEKKE